MFLNGLRRQIFRVLSENRILIVPVGVVNQRKSAGAFLTSNDSCVTNKVLLGRSLKLSGRCRGVSVEYVLERRLVFAEKNQRFDTTSMHRINSKLRTSLA